MLVATNYFTKWMEAEALGNIQDMDVKKFVWKNIITRLGVTWALVLENRLQFDGKTFREYYSNLGITSRYSSSTYPPEQWASGSNEQDNSEWSKKEAGRSKRKLG